MDTAWPTRTRGPLGAAGYLPCTEHKHRRHFGACHEQTARPRLTQHMEMQRKWGRFSPSTKPPAQVKGNEVSDREVFPKTPSDQPSLIKLDGCWAQSCHQSQAGRGRWGCDTTVQKESQRASKPLSQKTPTAQLFAGSSVSSHLFLPFFTGMHEI